jgi:GNAT superfamily N-acetyltransferase
MPAKASAAKELDAPPKMGRVNRKSAGHGTDDAWRVGPLPVHHPDAVRLLCQYFTELVARYWQREAAEAEVEAAMAGSPSDDLAPPTGVFLVARRRGEADGCAGVRLLTPTVAELTRVFVRPAARGAGIGARLLAAAEASARSLGCDVMRLDTRHDLVEARRLYARHGYREIPAYNDDPYADHWFEKQLG